MASELATKIAEIIRERRAGASDDLVQMRADMIAVAQAMPPTEGVTFEEHELAGRRAVVARSADAGADAALLYLHGGAYVAGAPESHTPLVGALAQTTRVPVWTLDYRLAPEHPFPAALDDALEAHAALLEGGLEPSRVVLGGDSAGGGLTFATALSLVRDGRPLPAALFALSPWLDLRCEGTSWRERADQEVMLTKSRLDSSAAHYAGPQPLTHVLVSPGLAEPADLAQLPPTLLQVGTAEVLFDDSADMHRRLRSAGVDSALETFEGLFHVFQGVAFLPEAIDANANIGRFVRAHLNLSA